MISVRKFLDFKRLSKKDFLLFVYIPVLLFGLFSAVIMSGRTQLFNQFAAPPEEKNNSDNSVLEGTLVSIHDHETEDNIGTYRYLVVPENGARGGFTEIEYKGEKQLVDGSKVKVKKASSTTEEGVMVVDETGGTGEILVEGPRQEAVVSDLNATSLATTTTTDRVAVKPKKGYKRVAIVMLHWSDYPAQKTPAQVNTLFNTVESYFYAESNKNLVLVNDQADVFGSINLGTTFSCDKYRSFLTGNVIDTAVTNLHLDYSYYQHVLVYVSVPQGVAGCAYGSWGTGEYGYAPNTSMARVHSGVTVSTIEHEIAHNLTVRAWHSASLLNCGTTNLPTSCTTFDQTDNVELLGHPAVGNATTGNGYSLSAYHRELMGWNTLKNVNKVTGNGTYRVTALENDPNYVKDLQICRDADTYYSIEKRMNIGHDAGLPSNMTSGVTVRLIGLNPNAFPLNYAPWRGGLPDSLTISQGASQTSWGSGQSFRDAAKGITVTVAGGGASYADVRVQYDSPPVACPEAFGASLRDYQISSANDDFNVSCGTTFYGKPEVWFGNATSQFDPRCVAGNKHIAKFQFPNIPLQRFTTINSAAIEFVVDGPFTNSLTETIKVTDGTTTSGPVTWSIGGSWDDGQIKPSVSITGAIQQIINSASWAPGKTLTAIVEHSSGSGARRVFSYERSTSVRTPLTKLIMQTGAVVTPSPTPAPTGITIYPDFGDSYVDSNNPTTNYGSALTMSAKASPTQISLMKFNLQSLANRSITNATLKLFTTNASAGTVRLRGANSTWDETTVTYNTRPTMGSAFTTFVPSTLNAYKSINITNFVNQYKGMLVSIAVDTTSTDNFVFTSYDAFDSGRQPHLLVTY